MEGNKLTDEEFVPLKFFPVDLLVVHLDEAPVVDELTFPNLDLRAVKNESDDTRASHGEVFGNVAMKLVSLFDLVLRSVDQAPQLITPQRGALGLVVCWLREPSEVRIPNGDGKGLDTDELHNGRNSSIIRASAEEDNVLTWLAVPLARVLLVFEEREWVGNVGAGQGHDTLVCLVRAETEEHTARALKVR